MKLSFPRKRQKAEPCCNGGKYDGHSYQCNQPEYTGPPPLPGHGFCSCGRAGGNYCWKGHGPR